MKILTETLPILPLCGAVGILQSAAQVFAADRGGLIVPGRLPDSGLLTPWLNCYGIASCQPRRCKFLGVIEEELVLRILSFYNKM